MIGKQFLLCSIDIRKKDIWAKLINSSDSIEEKHLMAKGWELKKNSGFSYCKDSTASELSHVNSLEKARNLELLWNGCAETCENLNREHEGFTVLTRETSLIVDYHGNFLLIISYTIFYESLTARQLADTIFKEREIISNLGDAEWFDEFKSSVKNQVSKYVRMIARDSEISEKDIAIGNDSAFPILFTNSEQKEDFTQLFRNEESAHQRSDNSLLCADYSNSFFHVGWNYTLAVNLPIDAQENILSVMTKMQMSYYKLRYYKQYFNEAFTEILMNTDAIDSNQVDFFDKLKLNYRVFLANYFKFKHGLYPKYSEVMERVEKLWNIDKDTNLLEKTFDAHTEFVNKKHAETTQRLNDKQNQALNIIALLQVAAFVSVIYDSLEFESKWPSEFYTALSLIVVSVVSVITLYISFGIIRKNRKR